MLCESASVSGHSFRNVSCADDLLPSVCMKIVNGKGGTTVCIFCFILILGLICDVILYT